MEVNENSAVRFICMEGPDGSGKTTQLELAKTYLELHGFEVVVAREPGGTAIGAQLRQVFLDGQGQLDSMAEVLILLAAKAQLRHEVIDPALERGAIVLMDRYTDSLFAYQGYAKCADADVWSANPAWASYTRLLRATALDHWPHMTFFLDVSTEVAQARMEARGGMSSIDRLGAEFHTRVSDGYKALYQQRRNVVRLDADLPVGDVKDQVFEYLTKYVILPYDGPKQWNDPNTVEFLADAFEKARVQGKEG